MARDKKYDDTAISMSENEIPTEQVSVVEPKIQISFDRWFATTGKPDHHKAGMRAFALTNGKKTINTWNDIFKTY